MAENIMNKDIQIIMRVIKEYKLYPNLRQELIVKKIYMCNNTSHYKWVIAFMNFLIDNNALRYFMFNLNKSKKIHLIIQDIGAENFLIYAFFWGHTQQGSKFWANLNIKWMKEVKKIL